jgi:hypothetical protein
MIFSLPSVRKAPCSAFEIGCSAKGGFPHNTNKIPETPPL